MMTSTAFFPMILPHDSGGAPEVKKERKKKNPVETPVVEKRYEHPWQLSAHISRSEVRPSAELGLLEYAHEHRKGVLQKQETRSKQPGLF
jgi:hypothetical protein